LEARREPSPRGSAEGRRCRFIESQRRVEAATVADGDLPSAAHCSTRLATTHHSSLGSFSAGSTGTIATKYSFFQVFRDLQNYLAKFSKILQNFEKKISDFRKNQHNFLQKSGNFAKKL
jgi:hypothetical protein